MGRSNTRGVGLLAGALCALALGGAPARADEAGARRFVTALGRLDDAPDPVSAIFVELRALEGVRLDADDAPSIRARLGGDHPTLLPIVDALQALTVEGGTVSLTLTRPVVLRLKRAVLALAPEVSFRVQATPAGDVDVDRARGIKVGRTAGLTLPLRSLSVSLEDGARVTRAVVLIAAFPKTITLSSPAPTDGLAGGVGSSTD